MKIESVVVNDVKAGKFFAFVKQFPGVCAQGNSIKEVQKNIQRNFEVFIEKARKESIEFNETEIY